MLAFGCKFLSGSFVTGTAPNGKPNVTFAQDAANFFHHFYHFACEEVSYDNSEEQKNMYRWILFCVSQRPPASPQVQSVPLNKLIAHKQMAINRQTIHFWKWKILVGHILSIATRAHTFNTIHLALTVSFGDANYPLILDKCDSECTL